jgi:hypothetical protein
LKFFHNPFTLNFVTKQLIKGFRAGRDDTQRCVHENNFHGGRANCPHEVVWSAVPFPFPSASVDRHVMLVSNFTTLLLRQRPSPSPLQRRRPHLQLARHFNPTPRHHGAQTRHLGMSLRCDSHCSLFLNSPEDPLAVVLLRCQFTKP